jgi:hypothetical protein
VEARKLKNGALGQCCGSGSASNKNPDSHQSDQLDPDPDLHQFTDDKSKRMEYEPI